MRVIGGTAGGRKLLTPSGLGTRPSAARVRQSLFDVLGQRCDELVVLDLFAGSGSLGLEALSRGASRCVFVEDKRKVASVLEKNVSRLGFEDRALVKRGDAGAVERWSSLGPFDLVLADPPYGMGSEKLLLKLARCATTLLERNARVVLEHDRRQEHPSEIAPLVEVNRRRFGDTTLTFFIHEVAP